MPILVRNHQRLGHYHRLLACGLDVLLMTRRLSMEAEEPDTKADKDGDGDADKDGGYDLDGVDGHIGGLSQGRTGWV